MTTPETPERLPGPLYASWNEAMADPDLDRSKPWFLARPPGEPVEITTTPPNWIGWNVLGSTDDTGAGE